MKRLVLFALLLPLAAGCGRFNNEKNAGQHAQRIIVIGQVYNEIIWDLGAEQDVAGVDLSSTYPPAVKKVQTVGYHRALSAEGILSLKPTLIIHDGSVGPPQLMQQIASLKIPTLTFKASNGSIDGTKALIREIGAYFQKQDKAEELCRKLDADLAKSLEEVKRYTDQPRVAVIHFGRASNIYLVVGNGGKGDGGAAAQMVDWAGGRMAIDQQGMEKLASPEVIAKANPDVILMTEFGFDRLGGSLDQ
ncbi:MAG TPA: ABC transporter substrate-binding protein, partial [Thermoanaerobaculia bacterium]